MRTTTRMITYGAMFIGMGILLPIMFHTVGLGRIFLPMHVPVLLAGFFTGPVMGAVVGAITPLLSSLFTGMPPMMPPIAQTMILELATFGLVTGLLYQRVRVGIYPSLVLAMIAGRLVSGIAAYFMLPLFGLEAVPIFYPLTAGLVLSLPGIVLQLVIIPPVVYLLSRYTAVTRTDAGRT